MAQAHAKHRPDKRSLFQLIILGVALYVFLPQFKQFGLRLVDIGYIQKSWVVVAIVAFVLSFFMATGVYMALVGRKLHLRLTLQVQVASAFTNRLLPAGIGGMTTSARYLYKRHVNRGEAVLIVGANQLLGFASYVLLIMLISLRTTTDRSFGYRHLAWETVVVLLGLAFALFLVIRLVSPRLRKQLVAFIHQVVRGIEHLAKRPIATLIAFGYSLAISFCYGLCLYACVIAAGGILDFPRTMLVYLGGAAIGSVAPTPGGLGAVEAALLAGLRSFGVEAGPALTAVLLYRLISFWLPMIPGYLLFRRLVAQHNL